MASAVELAKAAKSAFEASQLIPADERVEALHVIREELESLKAEILAANSEDLRVCLSDNDLNIGRFIHACTLTKGCPSRGRCGSHVRITAQAARLGQSRQMGLDATGRD